MPKLRGENPRPVNTSSPRRLEEKEIRVPESTVRISVHNDGDATESVGQPTHEPPQSRANARQVGGAHYKGFRFETWDVILDWGLGYLDGNAVKYLSRWRLKGGVEDLKKARHYLDKLIETEEQKGG